MSSVISIDESSFDNEVLNSKVPVLVEFGATWCGPCKRQLPILETLSVEFADKLKVVKIDIDDNPNLSNKFGVKSVPTLMTFKNGEKLDVKSGLASANDIKSLFLANLGI